jgi:hypothetical protein
MSEARIAAEMAQAAIVLMLRAGLIDRSDVVGLAAEYDLVAGRNKVDGPILETTAHRLRTALLAADPPPAIDPEVEFRAQYERRQMVERTALYERQARERDGGNPA